MSRQAELYDDSIVTLQRYANLKVTELALALGSNLEYFDWDTVSEAHELPDKDLFGPAGLAFTDDGKMFHLVFSFGVSTVNDLNLSRLRKMVSSVYADFVPDTTMPVYRHSTGVADSWMQINPPVSITPITRAISRPLQFVTVNALLDPFAPYRP